MPIGIVSVLRVAIEKIMGNLIVLPSDRKQSALGKQAGSAKSTGLIYARPARPQEFQQINDFSLDYESKRRNGIICASLLIFFSFVCLGLFISGINIVAAFSAGALLMCVHLVQCARGFFQEEERTRIAYRAYLRRFPLSELVHVLDHSILSEWSRYELQRYIELHS